ncbi:hypothetical protein [Yoonia sp. R2-816]|uniref:hypothetical protein n=1 Tax=Yoonia sp. R2-816 TaxID=3342638 RepID=UPI00372B11C1
MFEVVIMLIIGAVVVGVYVVFTTDATNVPEVPAEKPYRWSWGSGPRAAMFGIPDDPSELVVLPNGELGYHNGFDLSGKHYSQT